MLTPLAVRGDAGRQQTWRRLYTAARGPLLQEARVCLELYVFAHEFRVNPHFDLEPDYIIRKGI